jgi:hypothetical protein
MRSVPISLLKKCFLQTMKLRNSRESHTLIAKAVADQLRTLKEYIFEKQESFPLGMSMIHMYHEKYAELITEEFWNTLITHADEGRPCLIKKCSHVPRKEKTHLFGLLTMMSQKLEGIKADVKLVKETCHHNSDGHLGVRHVLYSSEFPIYRRIFAAIISSIERDREAPSNDTGEFIRLQSTDLAEDAIQLAKTDSVEEEVGLEDDVETNTQSIATGQVAFRPRQHYSRQRQWQPHPLLLLLVAVVVAFLLPIQV